MNPSNEKKLDQIISSALDAPEATLDFQAWKQNNTAAIEQLKSQTQTQTQLTRKSNFKLYIKLTAAAAIIIVASIFTLNKITPPENSYNITLNPSSKMSILALNAAYRDGGMEAVDENYQQAYAQLGPRTSVVLNGDLY